MKSNLIYSDDKLYVYLNGKSNKKDFRNLYNKLNYLVNSYDINDIIFNINNLNSNQNIDISNFIDNYKYEFSGEITIEK